MIYTTTLVNSWKLLTGYITVLSGHYSSIGVFKHQDFTEAQHEKQKRL